jgi:hypothetical protein
MKNGVTRDAETVTLRISNSGDHAVQFVLEPWGEIYPMPAGATFVVISQGAHENMVEVTFDPDTIKFWGASGSTASLFHEGKELGAGQWQRAVVPEMPKAKAKVAA